MIDDGELTHLSRKGDGVQSLVALAMMRHASEQQKDTNNSIIAIEEPESHLHPEAIHELRNVVRELSSKNQVVISSHSPLFAARDNAASNIIVYNKKARPASNLGEVREILGVRFSDNLRNASLIILPEGINDKRPLQKILEIKNEKFLKLFHDGIIQIVSLDGAPNLSSKAGFYTGGACQIHCILDNDKAGREAFEKAKGKNIVEVKDVTFCMFANKQDAEMEDFYNRDIYKDALQDKFGVDVSTSIRGFRGKWSDRMRRLFELSGKPWNEEIKSELKHWLSDFAARNADKILCEAAHSPINALVNTLLKKIPG